jgi:glutaredoxin
VTTQIPEIVLYGRPGCHLCEEAYTILDVLVARRAREGLPLAQLVERNIEDDEAWHRRYLFTIPVIAINGAELELATSPEKIGRFVAQALDGAPSR